MDPTTPEPTDLDTEPARRWAKLQALAMVLVSSVVGGVAEFGLELTAGQTRAVFGVTNAALALLGYVVAGVVIRSKVYPEAKVHEYLLDADAVLAAVQPGPGSGGSTALLADDADWSGVQFPDDPEPDGT